MGKRRYVDIDHALDILCDLAEQAKYEESGEAYATISDSTGHPIKLGVQHWYSKVSGYQWFVSIDHEGSHFSLKASDHVSRFIKLLPTADSCKLKIGDELFEGYQLAYHNWPGEEWFGFLTDVRNGDLVWGNSTLAQCLGLED